MPKRAWEKAITTTDPKERWRLTHIGAIKQSPLHAMAMCKSCEISGRDCMVLNGTIEYEEGRQYRCLACLERKIVCRIGSATWTTPAFTVMRFPCDNYNINPRVYTSRPSGPGPHRYPHDITPSYMTDNPFFPEPDSATRLRQMRDQLAKVTEEKAKAERAGQDATLAKERAERLQRQAENTLKSLADARTVVDKKLQMALEERKAADAARVAAERKLAIVREAHDMEREMYLEKIQGLMSVEVKQE